MVALGYDVTYFWGPGMGVQGRFGIPTYLLFFCEDAGKAPWKVAWQIWVWHSPKGMCQIFPNYRGNGKEEVKRFGVSTTHRPLIQTTKTTMRLPFKSAQKANHKFQNYPNWVATTTTMTTTTTTSLPITITSMTSFP